MTFRTMLLTAAMLLPLAFASTPVMAQGTPAPQARYSDPQGIPEGHRPPPGMCRVWLPGVAPGQQPAPVPCETPQGEPAPVPEPEPTPEPEPEPEPEPCVTTFTTVNGVPGFIDCNGVFTPAFPG